MCDDGGIVHVKVIIVKSHTGNNEDDVGGDGAGGDKGKDEEDGGDDDGADGDGTLEIAGCSNRSKPRMLGCSFQICRASNSMSTVVLPHY